MIIDLSSFHNEHTNINGFTNDKGNMELLVLECTSSTTAAFKNFENFVKLHTVIFHEDVGKSLIDQMLNLPNLKYLYLGCLKL